jgi:hypothetical protein
MFVRVPGALHMYADHNVQLGFPLSQDVVIAFRESITERIAVAST